MAKIVTITNPLTGQPAQVDQLEHTAQQIDDAITRSLPGGAIDITLANNDPRQWGLGRNAVPIQSFDNADKFGLFYSNNGVPENGYWFGLVLPFDGVNVVQMLFTFGINNLLYIAKRKGIIGSWEPWEFDNPSMLLGVEYRTTERYLGKPVYVKAVDCGAIASGTKSISSGSTNIDKSISAIGTANQNNSSYNFCFPYWHNNGSNGLSQGINASLRVDGIIDLTSVADLSELFTATVTIKYTKTTD